MNAHPLETPQERSERLRGEEREEVLLLAIIFGAFAIWVAVAVALVVML